MWLPEKVYESLPLLYVMIGALLLGGAVYIGVHNALMMSYAILGSACVVAGAYVSHLRHRVRGSARESLSDPLSDGDKLSV